MFEFARNRRIKLTESIKLDFSYVVRSSHWSKICKIPALLYLNTRIPEKAVEIYLTKHATTFGSFSIKI